MSGIVGIRYLDGRAVRATDVNRMLNSLSHRGPDGSATWCEGSVGLGHAMLHTTPESRAEFMPCVHHGGRFVLTADARIDNRADLIEELGWRIAAKLLPDSQLILAAYDRWGVRCTDHLVGDFAFAVWDATEQRIVCARDHFGVKPFYYCYQPGRLFAFASEIKGILSLADVPRRLNETRVGDFLQCTFDDQEITFYDGVLRLPPAHELIVTPSGIRVERYWSLDPNRELHYDSNDDYAAAFREIFREAVSARLRSAFSVGSSLSGGLDSSSIVCTARKLLREQAAPPLHTFSLVFDDLPQCDERPYIDAVLRGGDVLPHLIRGDQLSPFEELDRYLTFEDEASWVSNMCLHWAMHRTAAKAGVRVFLDGLGGDETVCHGISRLAELMRAGRLVEVAVSVIRLGQHFGRSPMRILKRHALRPALPPAVLRTWGALRRAPAPADATIRPWIASEFAERMQLRERLQNGRKTRIGVPNTVRGSHCLGLSAGITSAGFESIDPVAAAFSLEPRYPFQDKRLVEFCLALPADQKFRRGWTRVILRNAMDGVIPDLIVRRGGKGDLTAQFTEGFLRFERQGIETVVYDHPEIIAPYVDIAELRALYRAYVTHDKPQNAEFLWHPVMLAIWLQRAGFAPAHSGNGDAVPKTA